jgi:lipopolysaccharide transport system permease protein
LFSNKVVKEDWDLIILPKSKFFKIDFKEIWRYRDLLLMLVKRDIVTIYKQTILGPIWFLVQPILTTIVYVILFGDMAELSSDGLPKPLFYMSGIVLWGYFSECFTQTSDTFSANQDMFGKVYFPRLIVPLSKILSSFIRFLIQFSLFLVLLIYFIWFKNFAFEFSLNLLLLPILLILMAAFGLGFGLLFSSLTTKYRDLKFLIQFGVQLIMYFTTILPLSEISLQKASYYKLNPLIHLLECFRKIFLGKGFFDIQWFLYVIVFAIFVLAFGFFTFSKTEKSFIDTV